MGNYLKMASQQHISALLDLGWSQRRIAREVGVHRETCLTVVGPLISLITKAHV